MNDDTNIKPDVNHSHHRLVVKFGNRFKYPPNINADKSAGGKDDFLWDAILTQLPNLHVKKLFTSLPAEKIIGLTNKGKALDPLYQPTDLTKYYMVTCAADNDPNELINTLHTFEWVELAYMQGKHINPSPYTKSESVNHLHEYFKPAPEGIDIEYAWTLKGGKGNKDIKFVDIEQGWTLDFERFDVKLLPLTGVNNSIYRRHGTSVLEIIMGKETSDGTTGIAPEADGYVISQWRPDKTPNESDAILTAISYLSFGDIILLESQSFHPSTQNKLWPPEIQEANFQVIRLATALGIIVIEAGGNGDIYTRIGNDLDEFADNGKKILCPGSNDFRDSGAIIVAASVPGSQHTRMPGSNYGSRIDCYASGRPLGKLNGTSGAAAIIAGAAIAVQSISLEINKQRLSSRQMRTIFSKELYGTVSKNGHNSDKIGIMPDLKKIAEYYLEIQTI